ncbi:sec-independent protein translocase protein TatB [Erwinia tracheiphila PSU-1]|nr:sec-independent protein translocase protein TatB [Erwinia tracheiphila PSU-1]
MRAMRSLVANVQNELAQELKLQELQESLRKVEEASKRNLTPELKASMEELKQSAESMKRSYIGENEKVDDEANTIHNSLVKNPADSHAGVTPAEADHHASAPVQRLGQNQTEIKDVDAAFMPVRPSEGGSESGPAVHVSKVASSSTEANASAATVTTEPPAASILSSRAPASITQSEEQG